MQQISVPRARWEREECLVLVFLGIIVVLALQFILRFVVRYFSLDEKTFGRFWLHRAYLIAHLIAGTIALLSAHFSSGRGFAQGTCRSSLDRKGLLVIHTCGREQRTVPRRFRSGC
jgi:hypothetical protein